MSKVEQGYAALAAAVIEQAVKDVKCGISEQRQSAVLDIKRGALDPWIDVLCTSHDVYDEVQEGLRRVLMARSA